MNNLFNVEICGFKGDHLKKEFFNNYFYQADRAVDSHKDPSQLPKIEEHLKNIKVIDEITFFHRLCADASIAAVEYALPYIENIDLPTQKFGWSPLIMTMPQALVMGSFEKMQRLIDHGADVQYVSPESLMSPLHFCLLMKKHQPENCEQMYAFLVRNQARMISPTFLKALEPFEGAQAIDTKTQRIKETLVAEFTLEADHIEQFVRDVKEKAARELDDALLSYQSSDLNSHAKHSLFDIFKDLKSAGPKAAAVVNFELPGNTPFAHACAIFKEKVERGESKTPLKNFLNKILKLLVDCGAELHESSSAYRVFDSDDPSLKDKLIGYRQTLIDQITLKEKLFQKEFQRLAGIEFV